uniref:Ubiquitin-conjugating enzyme E2 T n=1 Tax=Oncorhynchus mykiss TaxID=8022 RepID=A0A8K9XZP2_ONCMY
MMSFYIDINVYRCCYCPLSCVEIVGGAETPFEGGVFSLEIIVPDRYPFEPPKMRFLTPIYHPNIDNNGRICHDALKLPPRGAWKPSLNISTVLTSIQLLMAEPNLDDPLMADISSELKYSKQVYLQKAKSWTEKHAVQNNKGGVVETVDSAEAQVQPPALKREAQDKTEEHPKREAQVQLPALKREAQDKTEEHPKRTCL